MLQITLITALITFLPPTHNQGDRGRHRKAFVLSSDQNKATLNPGNATAVSDRQQNCPCSLRRKDGAVLPPCVSMTSVSHPRQSAHVFSTWLAHILKIKISDFFFSRKCNVRELAVGGNWRRLMTKFGGEENKNLQWKSF